MDPKYHIRLGYADAKLTQPLVYEGEAHGLLCAPTRAGKFRDVLAQILMTYEGSCFVVDPKGQAAAVTAAYRQDVLKQDVCVLNPFNILPEYLEDIRHAQYDPLSRLDTASLGFAADADNLMEGLMPHGGSEVHWVDSARILGSGLAMWARIIYPEASLMNVYKAIAGNVYERCEAALQIIDGRHSTKLTEDQASAAEFVSERLARFTAMAKENREIQSVVSTAITQLAFMGNKAIAENLSSNTIDFRQMRHKRMTVYLILPGRYMASASKWFRLITDSWADASLHEGRGPIPVLGILDEFASAIGKLGSIETLLRLAAGYGTRLITVIQDLPTLMELYPNSWQTFLSASDWQLYFAPRDATTSEYCSKMSGIVDVPTFTKNQRSDVNIGAQYRAEMMPEDIRRMKASEGFLLGNMTHPDNFQIVGRNPYYKGTEFRGKYARDPYHPRATPV